MVEFDIDVLNDKLSMALKIFNPECDYCRQWDDPRINNYYMAITQQHYILLGGAYDTCDTIVMYYEPDIDCNIMTSDGLSQFINFGGVDAEKGETVFTIRLDKLKDDNIDNLISHVLDLVKKSLCT